MSKKTIQTIEQVVYEGKCPECGTPQTGRTDEDVDTTCQSCISKRNAAKFKELTAHLIGATITDVDGVYNSSEYARRCEFDSIVITTTEGKQFVVSGKSSWSGNEELEIDEVVRRSYQ